MKLTPVGKYCGVAHEALSKCGRSSNSKSSSSESSNLTTDPWRRSGDPAGEPREQGGVSDPGFFDLSDPGRVLCSAESHGVAETNRLAQIRVVFEPDFPRTQESGLARFAQLTAPRG